MDITGSSPDREIVNTRIVNAPKETVFRAWTEPDHLRNWWGPNGYTNTFKEFDLRPGGKWSFVMHGPDEGNYPNDCVFTEINEPDLIAWDHISYPKFQVVASFEEVWPGRTRVTFKMHFGSAEECNKAKVYAVSKNEENLDRLEAELTKMI